MKRLSFIILALVFVGAAFLVAQNRRPTSSVSAEAPLWMPELASQLNDMSTLSLQKASDKRIDINHVEGTWVVAQKHNYPADTKTLATFVRDLSDARKLEQKTAKPEWFDRLGLRDIAVEGSRATWITFGENSSLPGVYLGDTARDSSATYVRFNEGAAWLIDKTFKTTTDPVSWVNRSVIDVPLSAVQSMEVVHGKDKLVISRLVSAQKNFDVMNVPVQRALSSENIANSMATGLSGVTLDDVAPLSDWAHESTSTTKVRTFDGRVFTVKGYKADELDESWVHIEAALDAEAAQSYFYQKALANVRGEIETAEGEADTALEAIELSQDALNDVQEKVAARASDVDVLNQRLNDWVYRIADVKYQNLSRGMDELLAEAE